MIALAVDNTLRAPTYSVEAYAMQSSGKLEMQCYLITEDKEHACKMYLAFSKVNGAIVKWIEA